MSVQVNDKYLGHATAYAYAKAKGYTGTEEEFAELMASYASVAEEAAESASDAAASATTATTKAGEAAASATAAATAKTAAQTAQSNAETAATTATTKAGEATTAATTATTKASEATTAATTATGKATEAAGSATTATTKAGEASTSATNAAASATRAQEILDSIPSDYTQMSEDVDTLKENMTNVVTINDGSWEIGSYNYPDGANYASTSRIRLTKYVGYSLGYLNINALTGYEFSVYAWDASTKEYVGAWMSSNTFAKNGTLKWVSTFDLSNYDGYIVKVALRNASSPTSTMTTDLCINCAFTLSKIYKLREDVDGVRSDLSDVAVITKTVNLINPNDIVIGTIDNNGEPQTDTTYYRTDKFIEVKPNTTYAFRRLVSIFTYDRNKNFIEKLAVGTSAQSRQFGANAYYIKAISNVNYTVYTWLLNEGSKVIDTPWEPDSIKLGEDVLITEQIDTTLKESGKAADAKVVGDTLLNITDESNYNHGPYITKSMDFGEYYENSLQNFSAEEFDGSTTYAYVIDKFDALMALDSGYVTKNTLGQASGTDLYIYEYVITPHNYSGGDIMTYIPDKVPIILCNAGIHGFEKNSTYALYYFIKDLLTNWQNNPVLEALRNSVCIKFIPVSNPYGFNNDIYYNANDVNINRNFDTPGWTPVTDSEGQNTGLEPFDQPESQIIRDWLNANKANALMFYDIHTNGHYYATGYNNANSLLARVYSDDVDTYFKRLAKVFIRHINRQTVKLPVLYPTLNPANNEYIGRYQENRSNYGTSTGWGALNGFLCMTFELFNGLNITGSGHVLDLFTADTKKCCSEMIGNIIAETIMEYSK